MDWGLGIGPNPQSPSPIPNPQSPIPKLIYINILFELLNNVYKFLIKVKYKKIKK